MVRNIGFHRDVLWAMRRRATLAEESCQQSGKLAEFCKKRARILEAQIRLAEIEGEEEFDSSAFSGSEHLKG